MWNLTKWVRRPNPTQSLAFVFFFVNYYFLIFFKINDFFSLIFFFRLSDYIYNMCNHAWCIFPLLFYSINLICIFIFIIIFFNKKIILINKFSKYNQINFLYFRIKYLHQHLTLNFQSFILFAALYLRK